jgi:hypothetical protein
MPAAVQVLTQMWYRCTRKDGGGGAPTPRAPQKDLEACLLDEAPRAKRGICTVAHSVGLRWAATGHGRGGAAGWQPPPPLPLPRSS